MNVVDDDDDNDDNEIRSYLQTNENCFNHFLPGVHILILFLSTTKGPWEFKDLGPRSPLILSTSRLLLFHSSFWTIHLLCWYKINDTIFFFFKNQPKKLTRIDNTVVVKKIETTISLYEYACLYRRYIDNGITSIAGL